MLFALLFIIVGGLVALWFVAAELRQRRRRRRRIGRRSRRIAHQRSWDAIMRRDPVKRLTDARQDL